MLQSCIDSMHPYLLLVHTVKNRVCIINRVCITISIEYVLQFL